MLETRLSLLDRVRDPADAAAWSEFVEFYRPLLLAYVRKRGVGEHDALDVVQDAFARLVPALARFHLDHERGRFRTWLWQVAHAALVDWHRRRATRQRAEQEWVDQHEPEPADRADGDWDALYRQRILEVALKRVRESSSPASWACFEGRVLADRPAAEIAAEWSVSVNAVYIHASRLLARLREECAEFAETLYQS
ncbi:MAG TPA: sigma-70 family RNA polymerase sigma factor [Pirellulales bacterium]|nr:sigma-70 family RNA polymerase sigma factor [Pirellulales bacterium]